MRQGKIPTAASAASPSSGKRVRIAEPSNVAAGGGAKRGATPTKTSSSAASGPDRRRAPRSEEVQGAPSARTSSKDSQKNTTRPLKSALSSKNNSASPASSAPAAITAPARPLLKAIMFVGSYHNVAAAFQLHKLQVALRFTNRSHVGSVVDVAACSRFLVSSGSDESLAVQSVKSDGATFTDLGRVTLPAQANSIVFPDSRFLVCGMEDGTVLVYKTRDWTCAAQIAAHDRACVGVACHPSGALAVSVGNDFLVCIIDLARGTVVGRRKLDKSMGAPFAVRFSPDGSLFVVQTHYHLAIFDTASATEIARAGLERDPPNEIQTVCAASAAALGFPGVGPRATAFIVGIEAGSLLCCVFDPSTTATSAPPTAEASAAAGEADDEAAGSARKVKGTAPARLVRPTFRPMPTYVRGDLPAIPTSGVDSATGAAMVMHPRIRTAAIVDASLVTATSQGLLQVYDLVMEEAAPAAATAATEDDPSPASSPTSASVGIMTLAAKERVRQSTGGRVTAVAVLPR